jgi:hypothetical protein
VRNLPVFSRDALRGEQLLAAPRSWGTLDYAVVEPKPVSATVEWELVRSGDAHAIALWFEASLGDSIGYRTGPDSETTYPTALLPLERPLSVDESDRLRVDLWASPDGKAFAWSTVLCDASAKEKARFKQSTLLGATAKPAPRHEDLGTKDWPRRDARCREIV